MHYAHWPFGGRAACVSLITALLAACGSVTPPAPASEPVAPAASPSPQATLEKFFISLGDGFLLDFQLERKMSNLDARSCYFFIRGTVLNQSARTLNKASVLDFVAFRQGKQVYRDIGNPVAHIAPGGKAMFGLITSPVYRNGCPVFDRIDVNLRPSFLD